MGIWFPDPVAGSLPKPSVQSAGKPAGGAHASLMGDGGPRPWKDPGNSESLLVPPPILVFKGLPTVSGPGLCAFAHVVPPADLF